MGWSVNAQAAVRHVITAPGEEPQDASQAIPASPRREHALEAEKEADLAPHARSAVLMDFTTGKVLWQKNAHERLPMASITKIMTMLVVMEAIDAGRLKTTDKVRASDYASSMGGSQIFLEPGEEMSVDDLMKGIAIASANDACVALAEHLYGNEAAFVSRMNERAAQLGMEDTHFVNCNGLPADKHYSSAYDIALMSKELLKHPNVTRWTSVYSDYLRKDTDHPLWLVNTNKLVRFYDGVDGLKTGYTAEARYCLSATAKRGSMRLIAVVMGEPKASVRNQEVGQLLNWGFQQYTTKVLYPAGREIAALRVERGDPKTVRVAPAEPVAVVVRRGERVDVQTKCDLQDLHAPVQRGQRVGILRVYQDGEHVADVPLVSLEHVRRLGFWGSVGHTVRDLIGFGRDL
jgi:D-alanyl-D-alanine carboxypeptidase (penicillin-binding protein 5/6)